MGILNLVEDQERFLAHGTVTRGEERPETGRVARRDLRPQRSVLGHEVGGGEGEPPTKATVAVRLVDLDADLPPVGEAPTQGDHTAPGGIEPQIVAVAAGSPYSWMIKIGHRG